ncbi:MAG TPA: hypothetical protein VFG71_06870 [Nitrospiraceae bacterium]|nr:hypothetical protein [Nitrospiraceae bacterium]
MAIPWVTALYVVRKLLPVVIDKAPELLKTMERRRAEPVPSETTGPDSSIVMLQERLEALEQLTAAQTETITRLQAILHATRRSLTLAWTLLAAAILVGASMAIVPYFRS